MARSLFLLVALLLCGCARQAAAKKDAAQLQLERLVADVCQRGVVLLGEDAGHGAGRTVEVKAEMVQRLVRDSGMRELLSWHRSSDVPPRKTLVWCSTVHAAKTLAGVREGRIPLGQRLHAELGDRMAVIGFTAVAGCHGRPGSAGSELPLPGADTLEVKAALHVGAQLRYPEARELAALGMLPSRALSYAKPDTADWSAVLDGLVVLAQEAPMQPVVTSVP